jgi:ubiquinone/menaquinone biosynthesis methyltransferase
MSTHPAQNPESTQFGEKDVTPEQKTAAVRGVFDSVADNYDIMNDLMSGGIHRLWKDHLIRRIRPKAGLTYLDVAGGTGDIAFRILNKIKTQARKRATPDNADTRITLCDLNWDMLRVGRDRAIDKGWLNDFDWITGNAEFLPLPSNSVDVYTIAFGLRNVTRIDDALKEVKRVLKPGGRFFCLEFSHVDNPLLKQAYDAFSFTVIPKIGEVVAKDRESYQYLVESIRKFPRQRELQQRMTAAGLSHAKYENLTFGVAAIHSAIKAQ